MVRAKSCCELLACVPARAPISRSATMATSFNSPNSAPFRFCRSVSDIVVVGGLSATPFTTAANWSENPAGKTAVARATASVNLAGISGRPEISITSDQARPMLPRSSAAATYSGNCQARPEANADSERIARPPL